MHSHMHSHMRVPRMNRQWEMSGVPERLGLGTDLEIHYLTKLLIWGMG